MIGITEQFPVHYEHTNLKVFTNPNNEIFVQNTRTGITLRINSSRYEGLEFTTNGKVQPVIINNMIGWSVEL